MNKIPEETAAEEYERVIDAIYGEIRIEGMTFPAGRILRELDPIAFNEGMKNFYDAMDVEVVYNERYKTGFHSF
jgi:hypothetical protein